MSDEIIYLDTSDINTACLNSNEGYLISKSNTKYKLNNTILCSNLFPDCFIITVDTNDIIIDGSSWSIKQLDTTIQHVFGIQVKKGCKNIRIMNIVFDAISGGCVWLRGGNKNAIISNNKMVNCGYLGLTELDKLSLPPNISTKFTCGVLIDGGYKNKIEDVQIIDCTFAESGILKTNPAKFETFCCSIVAYEVTNLIIKDCIVDGCVGILKSWALMLVNITGALAVDLFITDVYSFGHAESIYAINVDGEISNLTRGSIVSQVLPENFVYMLENHQSVKDIVAADPSYQIEACHLKGIVPKHRENEDVLYREIKWKEFRTLGRLVSYQVNERSKTTAIYGAWIELLYKRILDLQVKVIGAFANLYLDGTVPLPAHRDQYHKWIIGLSFGETRTQDFIPDDQKAEIVSFEMDSGDFFVFSPDVNNRYQHRILPDTKQKGRRINLTFFVDVIPEQDSHKLLEIRNISNLPTFEDVTS